MKEEKIENIVTVLVILQIPQMITVCAVLWVLGKVLG